MSIHIMCMWLDELEREQMLSAISGGAVKTVSMSLHVYSKVCWEAQGCASVY